MRDIEINVTDTGLRVLFDGYPSPRFERYLRNAGCVGTWARRAYRVFIVGPLWAFGFAIVIGLIDGSLNLTAGATNDLHRLQVAFDVKPRETLAGTNCVRGDVALQGQRCEQQTREANEASDLLRHVQLLYLVGIWFGIDALLRERRAKLRDGQDGSRFSAP